MSKYIELGKVKEMVFNADISMAEMEALYKSLDELPTIEVSEGVIGQGSGDIDWQAVASTGQEIYAKGYEDCSNYYKGYCARYEDGCFHQCEDCISKSALISFIDAGHLRNPNEKCYSENDVVELIKNAPSVVPRLDKEDLEDIYEHIAESYVEGYMDGHAEGEWISQEQGAFYPVECSNCHKEPLFNEDEDYEYTKYCPYCGAKMKGAE